MIDHWLIIDYGHWLSLTIIDRSLTINDSHWLIIDCHWLIIDCQWSIIDQSLINQWSMSILPLSLSYSNSFHVLLLVNVHQFHQLLGVISHVFQWVLVLQKHVMNRNQHNHYDSLLQVKIQSAVHNRAIITSHCSVILSDKSIKMSLMAWSFFLISRNFSRIFQVSIIRHLLNIV